MTWLPSTGAGVNDRDAVLGIHSEAYVAYQAFLDTCATTGDSGLTDLCKARMAQLIGCREELALHSADRLAELEAWHTPSSSFSAVETAALAFVEQFILDPAQIGRETLAVLEGALGTTAVINFASVVAAYEASLRLSTLFDLEPA